MLTVAAHWPLNLYPTPVHHEEEAPPPRHQLPAAHPLLPDAGPLFLLHLWPPQREAGLQGHHPTGHLRAAAHPQWDPAGHVQRDPPYRFIPHPGFQRCPIVTSYCSRVSVSSSSQPHTASWSLDWCCWVFWKPFWSRTSWIKIKCCRGSSGSRSRRRSALTSRRQVSLHSWFSTGWSIFLKTWDDLLQSHHFSPWTCLWFQKRRRRPSAGASAKPTRVRNRATCCFRLKR